MVMNKHNLLNTIIILISIYFEIITVLMRLEWFLLKVAKQIPPKLFVYYSTNREGLRTISLYVAIALCV